MLTKEQFTALRDKGLSTEQIVSFEKQGADALLEPKEKSLFQKTADISKEALSTATDVMFKGPMQEAARPVVSAIRGVQGLIPEGKTGTEPMKTPWGEVKPYSETKPSEALWGGVEVLSTLPPVKGANYLGKPVVGAVGAYGADAVNLVKPLFKKMAPSIKGVATTAGEVLTGVTKAKLDKWYELAKKSPRTVDKLKDYIKINPEEPYLGLAKEIAGGINSMKKTALDTWKAGTESFKANFGDKTFDLSKKVGDLSDTLGEYGLKLNQVRDDAGRATNAYEVVGKGILKPFSKDERAWLEGFINGTDDFVGIRNAKDLIIDDLDVLINKFDEGYEAFGVGKDFKPTKFGALLMDLKNDTRNLVNDVLPSLLKKARKQYQNYYDVYESLGRKIMDSKGNVKQGAETFLGNSMNLNKGAMREMIKKAQAKLGINILDTSENLRIAKELSETVPTTTKNRMMDFFRGAISGKFFGGTGPAITATGSVGTSFLNPAVGIPMLLAHLLSSPKNYANIIEALAGKSKKLPLEEAIKKIPPEEWALLRRAIVGVTGQGLDNSANE
jgi:hypothetical protein